ncbi:Wzz/FepE/Etk N-terminal domain-containing protein [Planomicrobium sp. Y74]|uniref:YveK family protein n=1 Tax=Planomicrobium sp. Y74 TaxID=2478977 RepID=UPI000EF4450B|nr:Wzz/FepE/Etk N-terminal domain-containing protein [Planomicrobium sp. Y74]RLQ86607.1 chain-length determining protein [Planomicrobium sp. Y74]
MKNPLNILEVLKSIRKRIPLILLLMITFIAASGAISYTLMKPVYQASTQILINQNNTAAQEFTTQDINTNLQLISTYNIIIKSKAILNEVIAELDLDENYQSLSDKITVSNIEGTQILTIDVVDASMEDAVLIANATAYKFQAAIPNLMNVDNVNILDEAVAMPAPVPVRPDPVMNMMIGAVLGLLFGTGLSILIDQLNTTVRTEEDIEEIPGLQVLGIVSRVTDTKGSKKAEESYIGREMEPYVEQEKIQPASSAKIGGTY